MEIKRVGKKETKKNSGGQSFVLLEKGEERHKKNSGGQTLANYFWQREKRMNNTSFQGLENQKTLESFLAKGRRRRRSSKRLKNQCGKTSFIQNELEKMDVQIN